VQLGWPQLKLANQILAEDQHQPMYKARTYTQLLLCG